MMFKFPGCRDLGQRKTTQDKVESRPRLVEKVIEVPNVLIPLW